MADQSLNVVVKLKDEASAGLEKFADNVDKSGKSIQDATAYAQGFTKVVTALGVAVAAYALKTFSDFEKTMSGVKAVLTPTAAEFAALSEKVKQVGRDTVFTQSEIARTVEEMGKQGLTTQQIMGGALDAVTSLASAAGASLEDSATIAADAMNVFNIQAKDMASVVNQITGVANLSKLSVNDFSLALSMGGGVAKQFGVRFEEMNAVLASTANYFQGGSDQGTSFKQFLMNLTPTTDKARELMDKLGFSAYDASGKMKSIPQIADNLAKSLKGLSEEQKNYSLRVLFGSDSARMAGALAEQGAAGIEKMMAAIAKTDAADQAKTRLDNFAGSVEKLKGTIDVMATNLGAKIAGFLKPAVDALADALGDLGAWWDSLTPAMRGFLETVGLVAAALGSLLVVVGAFGMAASVLAPAIAGIASALAFLLTPMGLVLAAVTALGAAWATNFLGFRDAVNALWAALQPFFAEVMAGFALLAGEVMKYVDMIKGPLLTIWSEIQPVIMAFLEWLAPYFQATFGNLVTVLTGAWDIIRGTFQVALDLILGAVTLFFQLLAGDWAGAWLNIQTTAAGAWNGLKLMFGGVLTVMQGIAAQFALTLTTVLSGLWEGIKGLFSAGAEAVTAGWTAFSNGLANIMASVWQGIKDTIAASINWIIDKVNAVIDSINGVSGEVGITIAKVPRVAFEKGGLVPGFQSGGMVPGGRVPAHHDQVPALLDPGELILNRAQQSNVAAALSAPGGSGAYVVNVSVSGNSFYGSDSDFAEKVGDAIFARFNQHQAIPSF